MKNRIIGHRGAGILAPENTRIALKKAANMGLNHVEFDVRLTQDNVAVISHDDSLMRCAHIDQLISQSKYADIKDINIAEHYALEDLHETIPTLEEYLTLAQSLELHCQVELKPNAGNEEQLVKNTLDILNRFYHKTPEEALPLITSFVPECLKTFKALSKQPYKTGILVKVENTRNWKEYAQRADCDFIHVHALYLKKALAEEICALGYQINGFHLNHYELAQKAILQGCKRFTCDVPDLFLKTIS